jgi:hypothetical protein
MLRGINKQDIFEDDGDYLQTELHSQVNERLWCGNTPALSIDRCLLWSYTEVMKKEKMITEPSPGHIESIHLDEQLNAFPDLSNGGWAGFYGKLILGYIKDGFGDGSLEDKAYAHDHGLYSW